MDQEVIARGACALLLAVAVAGAAQAEPSAPGPNAEAQRLNRDGLTQYTLGRFDQAIEAFKAAYELAPTPGLLFNIAQAYRLKGDGSCAEALRFYRNYIAAAPSATSHARADASIAEMSSCVERRRAAQLARPPEPNVVAPAVVAPPEAAVVAAPAAVVMEAPSSRRPSARRFAAPLTLVGAGVASAAAGLALDLLAGSDYNRLRGGSCALATCPSSTWSGAREREQAGIGLLIGGGAIAVAGVVWTAVVARQRVHPTR
jgi:tetratricopeptide (TPR) repeat protein